MNSPQQIAENYIATARSKVGQAWYKTLISAVLAGAFISLGALLATIASSGASAANASLIKGAVFPLGLILVVICGAELFTGDCLLIAPLINRNIKVVPSLKLFGIAYCGNFIGAVIIALLAVYSHCMNDTVLTACVDLAAAKCSLNFADGFLRGILCNMLVCLAVWGAMASKNAAGKILAVYLPIFAFVVCGFEHSIANMYYLMSGLIASGGTISIGYGLLNCLLASTLGNIIGGALIAVAYWAVYFKDRKKEEHNEL